MRQCFRSAGLSKRGVLPVRVQDSAEKSNGPSLIVATLFSLLQ